MLHFRLEWMEPEIAQQHHRTLLDEAEVDRTMQRIRGETNQRRAIGDRLGNLLIALGCRLKRVPVSRVRQLTGADGTWSAVNGDGIP